MENTAPDKYISFREEKHPGVDGPSLRYTLTQPFLYLISFDEPFLFMLNLIEHYVASIKNL